MELAVISPYTLQPHNHPNPRRCSHSHHPPHPRSHPHHARSAKVNCWPWFRAGVAPQFLATAVIFIVDFVIAIIIQCSTRPKKLSDSETYAVPNFSKPHFSDINIIRDRFWDFSGTILLTRSVPDVHTGFCLSTHHNHRSNSTKKWKGPRNGKSWDWDVSLIMIMVIIIIMMIIIVSEPPRSRRDKLPLGWLSSSLLN